MALWEYKVITSGKGGFASPALLEKFLNDLGRDEWEIVCFQAAADNFLAFSGLARRSTQRDWTLEDAAAAAAKAEAEKLRAEFEAKFRAANQPAGVGAEERAPSFLEEKVAPDDGFRKPVDTSHDDEPEPAEGEKDEWDKLSEEDELPTFFDAIKPHMRRNQRGPGMSVGVDYLAKKWDQSEDDIKGALGECGFVVPADEDAKPEYVEYDGDLYWLNINRRGELWINTKEKPRPVFRAVKAARIEVEAPPPKEERKPSEEKKPGSEDRKPETDPATDTGERKPETSVTTADAGSDSVPVNQKQGPSGQLPSGAALLDKIRPHMRRNRRGPGGSGSTNFLSRALRTNEADLKSAFVALGLTVPGTPSDKPVYTEIANEVWWLNVDSRGGLWINGREKRQGENLAAPTSEGSPEQAPSAEAAAPAEATPGAAAPDAVPSPEVVPSVSTSPEGESRGDAASPATVEATERAREVAPMPAETPSEPAAKSESNPTDNVLSGVRPLLKETRTGALGAKTDQVAEGLGKSVEDLIGILVSAGMKVPEKPREKPVFVEYAGEVFWLNKNARGELWLNAKAAKSTGGEAEQDDSDEGSENGEAAGETAEATPEGEGDTEKKPRRGRTRTKKAE